MDAIVYWSTYTYIIWNRRDIYVMIRIDTTLISVQYWKIKIDFVMRWETNPNMVKLKKVYGERNYTMRKREYYNETAINNKAHRFSMMKWYDKVEQIRTRERM